MHAAVLTPLALATAACAYTPGAFSHLDKPFVGQRATVGCLDLAVERQSDLENGIAVLSYKFGNRCPRPAMVDLAGARVLAQTTSGRQVTLAAYDPKHEIRPLRVDGRSTGGESIAYPADEQLVEVCVDAASIAHERDERWLCFASTQTVAGAEVTP